MALRVERDGLRWLSPWVAFRDFDFADRWSLEVWLLRGSSLHVHGQFIPAEVQAKPYLPPIVFWEGSGQQQPLPLPPADLDDDDPRWHEDAEVQNDRLAQLGDLLADADAAADFEREGAQPPPRKRYRSNIGGPIARPAHAPRASAPDQAGDALGVAAGEPAVAAACLAPPVAEVALVPAASSSSGSGGIPSAAAVNAPPSPPASGMRAPVGRRRTVDVYPQLVHTTPRGPHGSHHIRLVDNQVLEHLDMRAICGFHQGCSLSRTCIASHNRSNLGRGRPLALLWCFLDKPLIARRKRSTKPV